jgi:hypothetical protein
VRLRNQGQTVWLNQLRTRGWVTLALRQGEPGSPDFREAEPRHTLPAPVPPGKELVLDVAYRLPEDYEGRPWQLDLVNERLFWFSQKGTVPAQVRLGSEQGR